MLGMPGMAMTGDNDDANAADRPPDQPKPKKCKPKGLGGFLKAQIGAGC